MARINIEDSLFKKKAWTDLCIELGDRNRAMGALFFAWSVAQEYWVPAQKPIPKDVWEEELLESALIECGLARETDDGVYMRGSQEQFAWLIQRHEAGRKGGRPKKTKPDKTDRLAEETGGLAEETGQKRVEPSISNSISNSSTSNIKNITSPSMKFDEVLSTLNPKAVETWSELYPDGKARREILLKAFGYYHTNKRKLPKTPGGWLRVFNFWLGKNYHQATSVQPRAAQAVKTGPKTFSQMITDHNRDLYKKIEDEEREEKERMRDVTSSN